MAEIRLRVIDAQGRRIIPLDRPTFSIGRRSASDLPVVGTDISRDHAQILQVDGSFAVRDLGSRFGTFVNGQQITEKPLGHGDRITLGHSNAIELVFLSEADDVSGLGRADGSGVTDLRQMAALLDGLRALGSGRVVDEVLTLVLDLAIEAAANESRWDQARL